MTVSRHIILALFLGCLGTSASAVAQSAWYDFYTEGLDAIGNSQWTDALDKLDKALERKPNPDLDAETYALVEVEYLPFYWKGVAYFNLGDWPAADQQFKQSVSWNEIRKSGKFGNLQRYQAVINAMARQSDSLAGLQQELSEAQAAAAEKATAEDIKRISAALGQGDLATGLELLADARSRFPQEPLFHELESVARQMESYRDRDSVTPSAPPGFREFDNALGDYLSGDFTSALNRFRQVAAQWPEYPNIANWLQRTEADMKRVGMTIAPETAVVTRIDTLRLPFAPIIACSNIESSTRDDSLLISGSVRDDRGLDYVMFTINGESFRSDWGDELILRPAADGEDTRLDFRVMMPLILGENQITIVAYDRDTPEPHRAVYPLAITRKRPIYQTPLFVGGVSALLLILGGALVISRLIKRRIAFVNKYNPYIAGAPVLNEKMFFGRENLIRRIINTLHNNSLMIHGPRRIGKTSLLHQLRKRLARSKDKTYYYVPVYIDLQGTPEDRFFGSMMQDIVDGCEGLIPEDMPLRIRETAIDVYTSRDFSRDIKAILQMLASRSEKRLKLVMLMDEVDELNSYSEKVNQRLRSIFMKTFAEDLVAVMSGSHIRKHWESEGSPWFNFFEEIKVSGISREKAIELIKQPVDGIFSYEQDAVELIIDYSDQIPYRIQKYCVNVISRIIEARRRRVTRADVEAVHPKVIEEVGE